MGKRFRFAVLRARHDNTVTYTSDQACREMLIDNLNNSAILQYWIFNTCSYLELSADLLPWVDISLTWAIVNNRAAHAQAVYDATVTPQNSLAGYDGFIILELPGGSVTIANPQAGQPGQPATINRTFDAGATSLANGKGAAVLPIMTSDHTFMCHEVGHVLGFQHTYGVLNNGIDWDGRAPWDEGNVYGDPYDIMSSATFGTRVDPAVARWRGNPTFTGPVVTDWPNPAAFSMGPAPARAHVHFWDEAAFPSAGVRHVQLPQSGQGITARIYRAAGGGNRTTLLAIHPDNEGTDHARRCFVEWRDASGWDQGLDRSGADLARQGVVVHALANTAEGMRCWYRGRILVPVETDPDLLVTDLPLVVTVTGVSSGLDWVEVMLRASVARSLDVDQYIEDKEVGINGQQTVTEGVCGRLHSGTYLLQRISRFVPSAQGFGGVGAPDATNPPITWTLGTSTVPDGIGDLNVLADAGNTVKIHYKVDPLNRELVLTSRAGEGPYRVVVGCTASEPDGSNSLIKELIYSPQGSYTGLRRLDRVLLEECMRRMVVRLHLRPRDLLVPPPNDPGPYREREYMQINRARLERVADVLAKLDQAAAHDLRAMADLRYGSLAPK